MKIQELMEYPKIRELLKKYWDNDESSGDFGTASMNGLGLGFEWCRTLEGHDFWDFLEDYGLDSCKEKYPEYFVKEGETPLKGSNVDIEHLRQWPKLYERAKHILSCVEGCDSLYDTVLEYHNWCYEHKYHDICPWEGTRFWEYVSKGFYSYAKRNLTGYYLFDLDKPEEEPTESTTTHKKFTKEDLYQTYWEGTKEEMIKVCNVALSLGYVFYNNGRLSEVHVKGSVTLDENGDILISTRDAYFDGDTEMDISALGGYSQEGVWVGDTVELQYDPKDVAFTKDFMVDSLLGKVCEDMEVARKTMSLAAHIITSSTKEYNGHAQLEVTFKPSLEELTALMDELDNYYTQINTRYSVYSTIESDGSGSIHVRNFWNKKKDSPSGKHKDKLIFSFGV